MLEIASHLPTHGWKGRPPRCQLRHMSPTYALTPIAVSFEIGGRPAQFWWSGIVQFDKRELLRSQGFCHGQARVQVVLECARGAAIAIQHVSDPATPFHDANVERERLVRGRSRRLIPVGKRDLNTVRGNLESGLAKRGRHTEVGRPIPIEIIRSFLVKHVHPPPQP